MERRLGRGLNSLIPDTQAPKQEASSAIAITSIRPNPYQPRQTFDEQSLEELRLSLVRHGLLQPIVVRPLGTGFEIISGERRWRAAQMAGWATIAANVRGASDDEMLELALVENVQRRDLDPLERAHGYQRLLQELSLTQDAVAERVGLQRSTITNHLRLLELAEPVQQALAQGLLAMGHARALHGLAEADQTGLMERAVRDGWSVREVERKAKAAKNGTLATSRQVEVPRAPKPPWARDVETRLRQRLGTKVSVEPGPKERGRIVIEYFDRGALERLLAELVPTPTL